MRKYILILGLLLFVGSIFAQRRTIEINKKYSAAKIYLAGKGTIAAKKLILVNDTLLQYNSIGSDGSINMRQFSTFNVRYVKIRKGNYAGIGVAVGTGIGLLCGVDAAIFAESDSESSEFTSAPYIIGFTIGGAIVGTVVGLCIPKWKRMYVPHRMTSYSIKIASAISPAYCGLGIKMKF